MQYKVPLLVHFYGDNCLPCKTLEQRVLSDKEVIRILNKFFICVRINATQSRTQAAQFQVHSWPTDVFVSPDGKTLYQGVCPQDLRSYIGVLENVAVMNRDRNVKLAAQEPVQPADSIAQQTSNVGTSSNMAPQLPPPGANLVTSSTTPSFYDETQTTSLQELQATPEPRRRCARWTLTCQRAASKYHGQHAVPESAAGRSRESRICYQPTRCYGTPPRAGRTHNSTHGVRRTWPGKWWASAYPKPIRLHRAAAPNANLANSIHRFDSNAATEERTIGGGDAVGGVATQSDRVRPSAALQAGAFVNNPYYREPGPRMNAEARTEIANVAEASGQQPQPAAEQPAVSSGQDFLPRSSSPSQSKSAVPAQLAAAKVQASPEPKEKPPTAEPAIGGFCPVALMSAQWVDGEPQFAVRHRGRIYWLSSQEAQEKFLRSPDECSPMLSGYDPMIFLAEGRMVEGSIEFGLHERVGGSNLFFVSEESKKQYEQDYDRHTKALMVFIEQAKKSR